MKIGIDLGTTNTKAIVLSKDGGPLLELSKPTAVRTVPDGGEIDPKDLTVGLFDLLRDVLDEIRQISGDPLESIGFTGMAEAGCLVNSRGEPQTPILLWYDRRGAEEAEELREKYEDILTSISGIRMSNVATIYKLARLRKDLPRLFDGGHRWFGVPEWAAWCLTAEHFTDRTLAVRTGAYSLETNNWSPEILDILGLDPGLFPQVIPARDQNMPVSPETAAYLGIPESVRVTIAGHDDLAAAYGAGLSPRIWVDSTGTAEGLIALTSPLPDTRQTVPSRMSVAPWYEEGQWALIAGIGTSGSMLADLCRQTGLDFAQADALAKKREPYDAGAFSAELTPARIAKLSFAPGLSAAQKVSAVYDRIIENFDRRARQIMQFAEPPARLIITGGHASLPELSRRKAEVLGSIPVVLRPKPEAAAFGAAELS